MKYECEMIRDLMGLCADGMASTASEAAVREHIAGCSSCAEQWKFMLNSMDISVQQTNPVETQHLKFAHRLRRHKIVTAVAIFSIGVLVGWFAYVNIYGSDMRLTARQAAAAAYDFNRNGKLQVLGEEKTVDPNRRLFWLTDGNGSFCTVYVTRSLQTFGCWAAESGSRYQFRGIGETGAGLYCIGAERDDADSRWLVSCYAEYADVQSITLTAFGDTQTVQPNDKRLAVFWFPVQENEAYEPFTGYAMNDEGKMTYELQFTENTGYFWKMLD